MSNKTFSVLLMLIAPAVWCPYQPSIYILLITSETMLWKYLEYKNEDSRMRSTSSLQHPLFCQAQHHGHSFHQVLCSPSLDHPARLLWITKKTWVQSTTIYMIPNHLHYIVIYKNSCLKSPWSVCLLLAPLLKDYILLLEDFSSSIDVQQEGEIWCT